MHIKWISHKEFSKLLVLLLLLLFIFSTLFVYSYIVHSLEAVDGIVEQRARYTCQSLQKKMKSMMLTAFLIYDDQRIANWINTNIHSGVLDNQAVNATQNFLGTNNELLDIILYNRNLQFLYSTASYTYRDISLLNDFEIKTVLEHSRQNQLTFHLVDYKNKRAIALSLFLPNGNVILLFDTTTIAGNISSALTESFADGTATFVMDSDGTTLIMGHCPDEYTFENQLIDSSLKSLFFYGYLEHSYTTTIQGWTVHSVLYMDSFFNTYRPFIRIIVLIIIALFIILFFMLLLYIRFLREPVSHLSDMLRASLPPDALAVSASDQSDGVILAELQKGIHYLLDEISFSDTTWIHTPTDNSLALWANALGNGRTTELKLETIFSKSNLFMGVAHIVYCESRDYLEQRRQYKEIGSTLRTTLDSCIYCLPATDDCFILLLRDESNAKVLSSLLHQIANNIFVTLKTKVLFAISPVTNWETDEIASLYEQLYHASAMGLLLSTESAYTLEEYRQAYECLVGDDSADEWLSILTHPNPQKRKEGLMAYKQLIAYSAPQQKKGQLIKLLFALISHYGKLLSSNEYHLIQCLLTGNPSDNQIEYNLDKICSSVADAQNPATTKTPKWHETVLEISNFINDNLSNSQLSVDLIAHQIGYSANYIRSMFKTYTGISITEHIRHRRIQMACSLLITTNATIHEIIERCGFNSPSGFFTVFKNQMGMTPNDYRQSNTIIPPD